MLPVHIDYLTRKDLLTFEEVAYEVFSGIEFQTHPSYLGDIQKDRHIRGSTSKTTSNSVEHIRLSLATIALELDCVQLMSNLSCV